MAIITSALNRCVPLAQSTSDATASSCWESLKKESQSSLRGRMIVIENALPLDISKKIHFENLCDQFDTFAQEMDSGSTGIDSESTVDFTRYSLEDFKEYYYYLEGAWKAHSLNMIFISAKLPISNEEEIPEWIADPSYHPRMQWVISLELFGLNIKIIPTELSRFRALNELDLSRNDLVCIQPLENLSQLRKLNLSDNQISDLEPLQKLAKLQSLNLADNQVSNSSPLLYLNLKELDLEDNAIVKGPDSLSSVKSERGILLMHNFIGCAGYKQSELCDIWAAHTFANCYQSPLSKPLIQLLSNPSNYEPLEDIRQKFSKSALSTFLCEEQKHHNIEQGWDFLEKEFCFSTLPPFCRAAKRFILLEFSKLSSKDKNKFFSDVFCFYHSSENRWGFGPNYTEDKREQIHWGKQNALKNLLFMANHLDYTNPQKYQSN